MNRNQVSPKHFKDYPALWFLSHAWRRRQGNKTDPIEDYRRERRLFFVYCAEAIVCAAICALSIIFAFRNNGDHMILKSLIVSIFSIAILGIVEHKLEKLENGNGHQFFFAVNQFFSIFKIDIYNEIGPYIESKILNSEDRLKIYIGRFLAEQGAKAGRTERIIFDQIFTEALSWGFCHSDRYDYILDTTPAPVKK